MSTTAAWPEATRRALLEVVGLRHRGERAEQHVGVEEPRGDVAHRVLRDADPGGEVGRHESDREDVVDRELGEVLADLDALVGRRDRATLVEERDRVLHLLEVLYAQLSAAVDPLRERRAHDRGEAATDRRLEAWREPGLLGPCIVDG